ncbi:MAG: metallophosphatase family protein, partial [Gemmataceae bacterium]|nr:metallophosphatase family protein [Gemmataceae bacterium]
TLHEPFGSLDVAGRTLGFLHGDDPGLLRDLIASEAFAYVFHGHTHARRDHRNGPTRIINPGALHRARPRSFAVLEVVSGALEFVDLL